MKDEDNRLIEYDIPLKEINEQSVVEKSTRHGNLSTVHIWWARKPLAASRAAVYSSLIKTPQQPEEIKNKINLLKNFIYWNKEDSKQKIKRARKDILNSFNGQRPKILDPFSGGGSMPLEALRLGGDVYSLEYNPIAVYMQKAYIENLQKWPINIDYKENGQQESFVKSQKKSKNLYSDFKHWARWVEKEAKKELKDFYEKDGRDPIGFYWLRSIPCQNPDCEATIPLATNFWLAKFYSDRDNVALKPKAVEGKVNFEIQKGEKIDFDPSEGTMNQGIATCPVCGSSIDPDKVKDLSQKGKLGQTLTVVLFDKPNERGKDYKLADETDRKKYGKAKEHLNKKVDNLNWDFEPVPNEYLPVPDSKKPSDSDLFFNFLPSVLYGMETWGDLFNERQKLSMIVFIEKVRRARAKIAEETSDPDYANAITSLLSLIIGRLADYNSTLCMLNSTGGRGVVHTFGRTALNMSWDYLETNPFSPTGANWDAGVTAIEKAFKKSFAFGESGGSIEIKRGDATRLPYEDQYFDLIITDPPYYHSIPYSYLSDYFYVWQKRAVGNIFPDLFSTPLSPKTSEIIEDLSLLRGAPKSTVDKNDQVQVKTDQEFQDRLVKSFQEIHRVLKPNGLATIVFAHKSTKAWESLIKSLLEANLLVTASWPVQTEKTGRLRSQKSATLKSSVYFICRKSNKKQEAYFEDITSEIKERIEERLDYFWETGIRGADFFVSAIGPAVQTFGKYKNVKKYSGNTVTVSELLEFVENLVARYALEKIVNAPPNELDKTTRFYLIWRWAYNNEKVPFDTARMLAQALGIELSDYTGKGKLVQKSKEKIKVRSPKEREKNFVKKKLKKPVDMVDVIHKASVLWKQGDKDKLNKVLRDNNYLEDKHFWEVVQAMSEILPEDNQEKKTLQGLLVGKDGLEKSSEESNLMNFMFDKEDKND